MLAQTKYFSKQKISTMKRYLPLFLAAAIASTPFIARAASPLDATYQSIQTDLQHTKKYAEALDKAQKALQTPELTAADKARFLGAAAAACMKLTPQQYEQAKGYYEQVIADKDIANADKITALKGLADAYVQTLTGQYIDKVDLSPAFKTLDRALQLPGLSSADQAQALMNIGKLSVSINKFDDGIAAYQKVLLLDVRAEIKSAAWQGIGDAYAAAGDGDKAVAIYQEHQLDIIPLYKKLNRNDDAVAAITKILDDPSISDADRWVAFNKLPYFDYVSVSDPVQRNARMQGMMRMSQKYLPGFLKVNPHRADFLRLKIRFAMPLFRSDTYAQNNADPALIAWAAPIVLDNLKLSNDDYAFVKVRQTNALAFLHQEKQIIDETAALQTDARLSAANQLWARLVNLTFTGKVGEAVAAAKAQSTLPEKEKAQAILDAARTALAADHNGEADQLFAVYRTLFATQPRGQIKSTFMNKAPTDVGSWLNTSQVKGTKNAAKLPYAYGDNLQDLLVNDSNTKARSTTSSSDKATGDTDTDFYTATDAQGIHLFFNAHDSHAQEVVNKLLGGGTLEIYFSPGKDQGYFFLMPQWPNGEIQTTTGDFITMYPNAGWRLPSTKDGTIRNDIRQTKDGFGVSIFFSWSLFYDKLPENGSTWRFEAIRWTRSGGFSFGGSTSVHNPSNWGDIVFENITPQNLLAIKRNIVFDAVAKYRAAKDITANVGRWNDPELGDPAFYQADVAPLLARLDKYADRVNKEMTDADVQELFSKAVPDWMEIEYRVAALRTKYLQTKLMKPAPK
jgi:tetratricopeptide (TPR) repeat protein